MHGKKEEWQEVFQRATILASTLLSKSEFPFKVKFHVVNLG